MGLWDTIKTVSEIAVDSMKNKSVEELCNAINGNSVLSGVALSILRERIREMSLDELFENYDEYSMYKVKYAAREFRLEISAYHIKKMSNRELFSGYEKYADDTEMKKEFEEELKKRGCI